LDTSSINLVSSDTIPFEISKILLEQIGFTTVSFKGFNDESLYVYTATNEEGDWMVYVDYDPVYDCADVRYTNGGADSMGCLLWVKKAGLDFKKLELSHQAIDGHGEDYKEFWDWPVTEAYCEAVAAYFNSLGV
jgi:hypothetical protein